MTAARFILEAAVAAGIRVGTDGTELTLTIPRGMPHDSWCSFRDAILKHRCEVIAIIMRGDQK